MYVLSSAPFGIHIVADTVYSDGHPRIILSKALTTANLVSFASVSEVVTVADTLDNAFIRDPPPGAYLE